MGRLLRHMATLAACLALVAFVALTVANGLGAQTPSPIQTLLGAVKDDTRATRTAVTSRKFGLREIKREVRKLEARSNRLEVTAEVNEAACASVPVQCGNGTTGHTFAAASSANHNPVSITVLVTRFGAPVAGLASSAFDFSDGIVPAGGPGITLCPGGGSGCASPSDLFHDAGNGLYLLWAHPAPAGINWKAGSYYARITVTDKAGRRGSALIEITVP
jgi:hypothetical protein